MFGGTNWGNLGYALGYTSYDVGAAIAEDRQVNREKYSELKLEANFLQVSPGYLTSKPSEAVFGVFTNTSELVTTELAPAGEASSAFYIVRHSDYTSLDTVQYTLGVTANGVNVTIPQLGGSLTLTGRDSKIHVVNYDVGNLILHYSSAEVLTWKKSSNKTILVVYGGAGETHELALAEELGLPSSIEGEGVTSDLIGGSIVIGWEVQSSRRVVHFNDTLEIHLLWRNEAYQYWVLDLPKAEPINNFVSASRINDTDASVIIKAGYLLRNASVSDDTLFLWGDLNQTTTIEVIASPLTSCGKIYFNGEPVAGVTSAEGRLTAIITFSKPEIALPDLASLEWNYVDSLPEIGVEYDDVSWTVANLTSTNNTRALTTPVSLYASDYGFHSGSLIYRGHFKSTGNESSLFLSTTGGNAFGHSVWLNSTYLGSWIGDPNLLLYNQTLHFTSTLQVDATYVITVLIDHMGLAENTYIGVEGIKEPRGILNYSLSGHESQLDIAWKLTGNIGGEEYLDISRGPRNEGATFAERQGYHLPGASLKNAEVRSPIDIGVDGVGIGFFATTFDLDIPTGYDVPLSFTFQNVTGTLNGTGVPAYRAQLFVNGWHFGEYGKLGPVPLERE